MQTIAERLKSAQTSIQQYSQAANRSSNSVRLLAVSKTKPIEDIHAAYGAGQRCFGENYVQEGVDKIIQLSDLTDIEWHFIGPLQSNKTKLVAEHFDWMQSVDRLKIAQRINNQRPVAKSPLKICIQVNISREPQKAGVAPEELVHVAQEISSLEQLELRGLMAIPSATEDTQKLTKEFEDMKSLFNQLQESHPQIDTLSMGMSSDLALAIEHGSTMVRLGTAIFGARQKPL
ncbi:YggS family pyridoxal phosphate-dependent enzyme [Alteromonadaceae bacterium M269]|nr:YggS family pyridoxal phosphate-dependent enzyme [Alteromonadaceae bacterium M269]